MKYNKDFVVEYMLEKNLELLEDIYTGVRQRLKYKCIICERISYSNFSNILRGKYCKSCSSKKTGLNRKHSFEYIKECFNKRGYKLLSKEYNKNSDKLKYICKNNHTCEITFSDFNSGYGCKLCGYISQSKIKSHSYEFIKEKIEKENYILKTNNYKNGQTKINLICPIGHNINITWNDFQQGKRCKQCWLDNNFGENHQNWKEDRTRLIRICYLKFDLKNIDILIDDLNYNNYIQDKTIYDIDHIFPKKAFIDNNLDNIYNETLIKEICNSRDNLRIILRKENRSKSGKYDQQDFLEWFNKKLLEQEITNA